MVFEAICPVLVYRWRADPNTTAESECNFITVIVFMPNATVQIMYFFYLFPLLPQIRCGYGLSGRISIFCECVSLGFGKSLPCKM